MMAAFKSSPQPRFADVHSTLCSEAMTLDAPCSCLASEFSLLPNGGYELDERDSQAIVFQPRRKDTFSFVASDPRFYLKLPAVGYDIPTLGEAIKAALDALDEIHADSVSA